MKKLIVSGSVVSAATAACFALTSGLPAQDPPRSTRSVLRPPPHLVAANQPPFETGVPKGLIPSTYNVLASFTTYRGDIVRVFTGTHDKRALSCIGMRTREMIAKSCSPVRYPDGGVANIMTASDRGRRFVVGTTAPAVVRVTVVDNSGRHDATLREGAFVFEPTRDASVTLLDARGRPLYVEPVREQDER